MTRLMKSRDANGKTVDVAATEKQSADFTVVSSWAATPANELLLLDRERQRFEALDVGGMLERAYPGFTARRLTRAA